MILVHFSIETKVRVSFMSTTTKTDDKRITVPDILARKGGEPITSLTAYTTPMARLLDEHVDILLVGDSLGMVLYGMDNTLGVTLDMMINHTKAVMRGSTTTLVVVDMPFATYEESPQVAFRNAARIISETSAHAVKLEGGVEMASTVKFLVERGIPVMGHVGLLPQSVQALGGFRARGKTEEGYNLILDDAKAIAEAGAFSIVIEGVVEKLGREITETIACPTIGIGASVHCDGQILVSDDVMGLFTEFKPKFVKRYADLAGNITAAAKEYAEEVRARKFPTDAHCFGVKK